MGHTCSPVCQSLVCPNQLLSASDFAEPTIMVRHCVGCDNA